MKTDRRKEKIRLTVSNKTEEREHFHQDIELFYVMEGTLDIVMGNRTTHMRAEDILVVNANKRHILKGNNDLLYARLLIEYRMVSDVFQTLNVIFWCDSSRDKSERYDELRRALKNLLNHHLTTSKNTASFAHISLCYQVIDLLSTYFLVQAADKESLDESEKFDDRIQQINNYIRANYNQQISLKELADKLYLSNGYLSRFFKKNYGMNFIEYMTNIRLFHAVDELLYTTVPITMIAYNNGFVSVPVFNKAFKKAYGETPSTFRRKSKERSEKSVQQEEDTFLEARLEKYLIANPIEQKNKQLAKKSKNSHSVKQHIDLKPPWGKTFNIGLAADLLKSEIQEHVILLKEILGVEYLRFCNPFSKEMLIDMDRADKKYNFSRLDYILDFLLRHGIKPHIEVGAKPRVIAYNVQNIKVEGTRNVDFPELAEWKKLMEAVFRHLIHRYGSNELDTWRLELWMNESKWETEGTFDMYFKLFDILHSTVKKYSKKIEIGGCGLRLDTRVESRVQFYEEWSKQSCVPDFLSIIIFPYEKRAEEQDYYSKRCTDNECVKHWLETEKKLVGQSGLKAVPIYITEWNLTLSARNYMNDSCFKGAYIIKNMLDVYGEVGDMAYWAVSDRASDYYDSSELLFGGIGIMTKDGLLKPAGFAFEFLHRLYSNYVGQGENYLISTDGHDSFGIICHNQKALGHNYYFTKEDEMTKEKLWKYCENQDNMDLSLELCDVSNGIYQIKMYRVNEQNGNVMYMWKEMDYEAELSRNDIKYFRRACEPKLHIQKIESNKNILKLKIPMQANEIVFVRVRLYEQRG